MEEDGDRKEGGSWLRSPACLLCVRKQLWPTEDYITYWHTYTLACTYADNGCIWICTHTYIHTRWFSYSQFACTFCSSSLFLPLFSRFHFSSLHPSQRLTEGSACRCSSDHNFSSPVWRCFSLRGLAIDKMILSIQGRYKGILRMTMKLVYIPSEQWVVFGGGGYT